MPTEISQKQISKLAAKLTIPVGGLCLNKFFISKNGLLGYPWNWLSNYITRFHNNLCNKTEKSRGILI